MAIGKGRPRGGYKVNGVKVPSVTTVLGRFKECGGLIHWAWALGMDGIDYRERRDSAANTGTWAHRLIEAEIHGHDLDEIEVPTEHAKACLSALEAYRQWAQSSRVKILATERSLVSERYLFGGTLDGAVAEVNGTLSILDFKTSNSVYPEYLCQIAAYAKLVEENDGSEIDSGHIIRFGKEFGNFAHYWAPKDVLDIAWKAFEGLLSAYPLMDRLKKVV